MLGDGLTRRLKSLAGRDRFDEVRLVQQVLKSRQDGGTMVDVGAHFGIETAMFLEIGWDVIAFEPDEKNRRELEIAFGRHPRLKIDARAVSDRLEEEKPFFTSGVSSGISGLSAFHESHEQTQMVSTTTFAEIVREYALSKVDFLKIDVEGFDFFVVKGIDWSGVTPDVIVIEFEDAKTLPLGYDVKEAVAYLRDHGYEVTISEWHPIENYGGAHQWRRFGTDPDEIAPHGWGNLIAYKPKKGLESLSASKIGDLASQAYPNAKNP